MGMIQVSVDTKSNNIIIDGERDIIKVMNRRVTEEMDLGDEDVVKMVTYLDNCDILIDKSIADKFEGVQKVKSVRYGYYRPCYSMERETTQEREDLENGNIVFHVRKVA